MSGLEFGGGWFVLYREKDEDENEYQVFSGKAMGQAICYHTVERATEMAREVLDKYPSIIGAGVVHSDIRFGGLLVVEASAHGDPAPEGEPVGSSLERGANSIAPAGDSDRKQVISSCTGEAHAANRKGESEQT